MRRQARLWPFIAGMIAGGAIVGTIDRARVAALGEDCGEPEIEIRDEAGSRAPKTTKTAPVARTTRDLVPVLQEDPISDLRGRKLALPLRGLDRGELRSSFDEERSGGRRHEAMDLLSPRHTPILAVEDGTIAKLFTSKAGGLTIYQFDPESKYAYYYAHLERYADGLAERERVKRGQVIGYVGTSGNAPPDTPHLHFAIFKMTEAKQWWKGAPIDPFLIWR